MLCLRYAMSQKIFSTNSLPTSLTLKPSFGPVSVRYGKTIASSYSQDGKKKFSKENEVKLGKVQGFLLASGLFSVGPIDDATVSAASLAYASTGRTGGRVGGRHLISSSRSHPTKRIIIPKKSRNTFNVEPTGRPLRGWGISFHIGIGVPIFGTSGWSSSFMSQHGNNTLDGFGAGLNLKAAMFFMFLGAVVAMLRKYLMPRLKFRDEDDYLR